MTLIPVNSKLGSTIDLRQRPPNTSFDDIVARVGLDSSANYFGQRPAVDDALGRCWAVHLTAWQVSGAVNASFPRNQAVLPHNSLHAVIIYSTDGAAETVTVDYPAAGCTVMVGGQQVEVHLVGVTSAVDATKVPPIIGGFITPAAGLAIPRTATFTTLTTALAGAAQVAYPCPVRARSYQLLVGASPQGPFNIAQVDGHGDPLFDINFWSDGDSTRNGAADAGSFRLHPDCQSLLITNTGGASNVAVQWDLQTAA